MDVHDIEPGTIWKKELQRNIRTSDFFLACISNNSVRKRGIIQVELKEALDTWKEKLDDDVYLIPVRLDECDVPESLAQFQWINLFADGGLIRLINTLISRSKLNGIIVENKFNQELNDSSTNDLYLLAFLDKVNNYKRPRLLVEGINTDNLKEHIWHFLGRNYLDDILIKPGNRCIYILEYRWWQGTNGSEDISDLIIDFVIFPKEDFLSLINSKKKAFLFKTIGERIRDDGFWEDGCHSFKYTHLEHVPIKITVDKENNQFNLVHDSQIDEQSHPMKYSVSSEETIF